MSAAIHILNAIETLARAARYAADRPTSTSDFDAILRAIDDASKTLATARNEAVTACAVFAAEEEAFDRRCDALIAKALPERITIDDVLKPRGFAR